MAFRKNPAISLRSRYRIVTEISAIVVLVLLTIIAMAYPRFRTEKIDTEKFEFEIEQIDIPETEQYEKPPAPPRPSIPIESENEDFAEDVTIEETEFEDFVEWEEPPPAPDSNERYKFYPYDEPPEPVGGYAAIMKNVKYPEIAQEAGIEGKVPVNFILDETGKVLDVWVDEGQGIPNTGLNEAAMTAIKKTKFKPAMQRDRPVKVKMAITINFKLEN
ncbi:MAG: energy transducer TonB [Candidatus Marinimicrobia bacterium]|nr:energy transducer TonB [Candidatus Neomarinimicrobiota bacterium]